MYTTKITRGLTLAQLITLFLLLAACGGNEGQVLVTSTAFEKGGAIPEQYTCDGADLSPPLSWSNIPEGTETIALICDDPDAPVGTWVHWVLYNLPAEIQSLDEGLATSGQLTSGAYQGRNDFGKLGYGGPCPPGGSKHRYYFKVYALSTTLALAPGSNKADLLTAMEGHILAEGQLKGKYKRK